MGDKNDRSLRMSDIKSEQCQQHVFGERGFRWQCQKRAIVDRDGKHYCKIHDPEYIKAKRKAWNEKWEREYAESTRRGEIRQAQLNATNGLTLEELQRLNPNLCKAAPDMYEALKSIRDCFNALIEQGRMALIFRSPEKLVNQALAKIESE